MRVFYNAANLVHVFTAVAVACKEGVYVAGYDVVAHTEEKTGGRGAHATGGDRQPNLATPTIRSCAFYVGYKGFPRSGCGIQVQMV
jgi:hypothetical protein